MAGWVKKFRIGKYSNGKSERSKLVLEKSPETGKCSNGKSERSKLVGEKCPESGNYSNRKQIEKKKVWIEKQIIL